MRLFPALVLAVAVSAFADEGRRGVEGTASSTRDVGFSIIGGDPLGMAFQEGRGRVSMTVEDRVTKGAATYGDRASLTAELDQPQARWRVELDSNRKAQIPGAPPGGVGVNLPVHGGGIGLPYAVQTHAAFALTGVGSLYRDDELVTDKAVIYAFAITAGNHSDDASHALLNQGREGDTEIEVLVTNLPSSVEGGMLRLFYDDVQISVGGSEVPTVATAIDNVPRQNPEDVTAVKNYGTTLSYGAATQIAGAAGAQDVPIIRPDEASNALDVVSGRVVGFRRFVNGQQVAAGGVDAARSPNDVDRNTGTGGSGATSGEVQSNAGEQSFTTAPQSTGIGNDVRVANSTPAAPLPPTPRPLNAYAASNLPSTISPVSADPFVPLPPTIQPANANAVSPVTNVEPVNPNQPAIGTSVEQFPGLTPTATNGQATSPSTLGLPYPNNFNNGQPLALGTANMSTAGTGGSGAFGQNIVLSPGAASTANNTVPGTGVSSTLITLPTTAVNPANIPGATTGNFSGIPVVGGAGSFPGLTPNATTPIVTGSSPGVTPAVAPVSAP